MNSAEGGWDSAEGGENSAKGGGDSAKQDQNSAKQDQNPEIGYVSSKNYNIIGLAARCLRCQSMSSYPTASLNLYSVSFLN